MNSNPYLESVGLDPKDYSRIEGPIQNGDELVFEVWEERAHGLKCPECGCCEYDVHHHYCCTLNLRSRVIKAEIGIIHRIVYRCRHCGKTFTKPMHGIQPGDKLTYPEKMAIDSELLSKQTFSAVARAHRVSVTEVVNGFDAMHPKVQGKKLPKILCIDEFKFKTWAGKYVCHLADFDTSESLDLIISRQKAYLDEFFSKKDKAEREGVRYLITDMYDEYAAMAKKWLPNATIVVDRFHVVKQLTEAVNSLRVIAMAKAPEGSALRNFMKSRWKLFLCRSREVPDKWYVSRKTGESWHYDEMIKESLKLDEGLKQGYDTLQELLALMRTKMTHEEAVRDVEFMAVKLRNCRSEKLKKVGDTYDKWKNGIAMGLAKNELGAVLSNARMEAANDVAQTEIDSAYGYGSFDRMRRKFLLTRWKRKEEESRGKRRGRL